jgi:hypothetical protein
VGQPGAGAAASGLAGWQAMAQAYAPADRLVWERRTLFGDEPQVRALTELLWRRLDFAAFWHFAIHPALSHVDEGEAYRCIGHPKKCLFRRLSASSSDKGQQRVDSGNSLRPTHAKEAIMGCDTDSSGTSRRLTTTT